jgi:hypothetical protein
MAETGSSPDTVTSQNPNLRYLGRKDVEGWVKSKNKLRNTKTCGSRHGNSFVIHQKLSFRIQRLVNVFFDIIFRLLSKKR